MAIYLKLDKPPETIKELLINLFTYNNYYSELKGTKTYSDKECKIIQCSQGRYRSVDDIVELVNTYFPNTEDLNIFKEIFNLAIKHNEQVFVPYLVDCNDVQRPTMSLYGNVSLHSGGKNLLKSKYNWRTIWESLGFTSEDDVKEHFLKLRTNKINEGVI